MEDLDPEAVRAAVTESPVDDALEELDSICGRYEDSLTLEIAEETYADVARGVDTLQTATCYVDSELSALKRRFPGTVFSKLPAEYDAYELTTRSDTERTSTPTARDRQ